MFRKIIVLICILATLVVCAVGLMGCNSENQDSLNENTTSNEVNQVVDNIKDFEVVIDYEKNMTSLESGIRLSSGEAVASVNGVSYSLSAEVSPADAFNLDVTWTLEWELGPESGESVYDYFVLEDMNRVDNISTVTITCIKAFLGYEAKIKCTTVDGGYFAYCKLLYSGKPNSVAVTYNGNDVSSILNLSPGHHHFDYTLGNVLGAVSEDYNTLSFAEGKLLGTANFKLTSNIDTGLMSMEYLVTYDAHNDVWFFTGESFSEEDDNTIKSWINDFGGITFDKFFSNINSTESGFNVTVKTSLDGFTQYASIGNAQWSLTFVSIPEGHAFYGQIKMEVPNTNVSKYISIYPAVGVLGIDLSDTSLEF